MVGREDTEKSLAPDSDLSVRRFIADAMLGRLARWLRFLGFDTLYYPDISDGRLIRIALDQERVILTRDTRLVRTRKIRNYLLIRANDPFNQLLEVVCSLKLRRFDLPGRCVKCNGRLEKVSEKAGVRDSVPEYVFLQHSDFLRCAECGRIYWEGSHPRNFRARIVEVLDAAS